MKKKTGQIEAAGDASLTTKRQPRLQPPIDAGAAREWEDAIVKKGGRIQRIQVRCTQAELEYTAASGASWRDLAELIGCTDRTLRHWRSMTRDLANDIDAQNLTAEERKALGVGKASPEAIRVVMKTIERGRRWARAEMVDVLRTAALGGDTRAAIHLLERLDRQDRQEQEADAEAQRRRDSKK
ncbi:MAG: hypothetical protein OXI80_09260 [Caldilineaceae bacterium]|nr:hypothetical protein [Caldilineaceae bacterium]MDE0337843.1 hypothetical protein [Caldilineaceae bacterium]